VSGEHASRLSGKRVVVIGAGLVGIATASCLQRDGHAVTVLDPAGPGEGASFGNAGCFNGSSVVPVSMPGVLGNVPGWLADPLGPLCIRWRYLPVLAPWLVRFVAAGTPERVQAQARALRGLLKNTLEDLAPLVRTAGAQALVHRVGHLHVYRSLQTFAKEAPGWALRRANGVAWEELDADELRQLDPSLSREYVHGVLLPANGHTTDPHALVCSLAQALQRAGGTLQRTRAHGFLLDGGRLRAVRTDAGDVVADAAVIAAGAWSRPLAATLGDRVPLETERGYHLMVRDCAVEPRIPTTDGEGKFVATPMTGGLRLAGTVELAGLAAPPNWARARVLLRHARRMYPALEQRYPEEQITTWMGHRPSLPDSLPVIGASRASPDVFYAFGHGHVGMTAAPTTGKVIADLVAGRPPAVDIAAFRADRFRRSGSPAPATATRSED